MKFALYTICFVALISLCSCNKTSAGSEHQKIIDSLNCTVNAVSTELKKIDTVTLQRALAKFYQYKQFIKTNVNDTISKSEADNLQHFYNGGKKLEIFQSNRLILISRANLISSQLNKLAADEKNNALNDERLNVFISQEKTEALKLAQLNLAQRQLYYAGMEEFKNSIFGVEIVIKRRNHGALPTVVKDPSLDF